MQKTLFIAVLAGILFPLYAQSQGGCTDPHAVNYDPDAQFNDGSCVYETTYYTPQNVIDPLPSQLEETSGLIYYKGGLWTHNDSGGEASIYKIDTLSGTILQEISIQNGENVDWEDLAQDDNYIYVGDIGNNMGNRTDLTIYRIAKSDIPEEGNAMLEAGIITYHYSDQEDFTPSQNNHNFDCEAMMVKGELIYLFSKNWANQKTKLYGLPRIPGNFTAALIDSFNVNGLITAAAYNANKEEITLLGYQNYVPFFWLLFDYDEQTGFFSGNKRRIELSGILGTQTEGAAYSFGKSLFISSEATPVIDQSVYKLNTGNWTDLQPVSIAVPKKPAKVILSPNPVKDRFLVQLKSMVGEKLHIKCYTPRGRLVYEKRLKMDTLPPNHEIIINTAKWKSGIYFVKIESQRFYEVKKLIVE